MPPPCCIVTALSCRARKMPEIESSIAPITKQLNNVTLRGVPAPAWMRPPGKNAKFLKMPKKRASQAGPVTLFNRRERGRDAAPSVGDRLLLPVVIGIAIFRRPHMTRNIVGKIVHELDPQLKRRSSEGRSSLPKHDFANFPAEA